MLDMLVWMLLQTVIDLHVMPMTRRELLGLTQTLPEPMHAGEQHKYAHTYTHTHTDFTGLR